MTKEEPTPEKKLKKQKKQEKKLAKKTRKAEKRKGIPKGYHSVQVYLCVAGAQRALDFYKAAFGAEQKELMAGPDGKVMHAEVVIGDSVVMLGDHRPEAGTELSKVCLYVYVADCDALYARAVAAGAKVKSAPADMFWGDRYGSVEDPFGNLWSLATQKEALKPEELMKRAADFAAKMAACAAPPAEAAAKPKP